MIALLGFTPFQQPESQTEIRRVSFASRSDGQGIVIRLHAKAPLNAYSEPRFDDNNQIEVILFNAKLAPTYKSDSPFEPVVDFDVNERNGHLVFKFSLEDTISVQTAAYPDQGTNDLLVGVTKVADQHQIPVAAVSDSADRGKKLPDMSVKKVTTKPVATTKDADLSTAGVDRKTLPTNTLKNEAIAKAVAKESDVRDVKAVESMPISSVALTTEEKAEKWTLDTVVIDAGHGGHDSGAVANGIMEKDVNLAVALKLGAYLKRFLKVNVVYTRTNDSFVELQERGHIANEAGAKLFISIHANSAPYSNKVSGTETYILGLHRTEKAKDVMERENAVVSMEANPDQYNAFYQNSILRTLALSANLRMSEKLAGEIESQFANRANRQSRGVKQAGLIVLWAASMPAVLVELGYLTNRFEAAYLNSNQGQDYLASAIFRAVRDFKQEYEKGLNLPAAN
ncbi:MAG: N-acetylmuramoyl-L-alanine amidase [Bacteroidota bacterium]